MNYMCMYLKSYINFLLCILESLSTEKKQLSKVEIDLKDKINYPFDGNFILSLLHPMIIMHILHTVFHTFLKVLKRRICLTIRSFFLVGDHFLYFRYLNV